jgi:hypothetical protein
MDEEIVGARDYASSVTLRLLGDHVRQMNINFGKDGRILGLTIFPCLRRRSRKVEVNMDLCIYIRTYRSLSQ